MMDRTPNHKSRRSTRNLLRLNSIACVRCLFLGLSVICLLQVAYQYGGGGSGTGGSIFGCTTNFYLQGTPDTATKDATTPPNNNKNLRQFDPDVPIISYIHNKKQTTEDISSASSVSSVPTVSVAKLKQLLMQDGGGAVDLVEQLQSVHDEEGILHYLNSYMNTKTVSRKAEAALPQSVGETNTKKSHSDDAATVVLPPFEIDPLFKAEQDRIDYGISDQERCARFGVSVLPPPPTTTPANANPTRRPRKLFFGSMLANENPEVLLAHAIEVYNQYDVIALVESNTTHLQTPRDLKFPPTSFAARTLLETEFFGTHNQTEVYIDYWLEEEPELYFMHREVEQRNLIWHRWKKAGMAPHDIGIMADLDEIVSRDFLQALRVCDFPLFRYDPTVRPDCQTPKMILSTIQFEASPHCVKSYEWFHPDLILGNCLVGIGDNAGRAVPVRDGSATSGMKGKRTEQWGLRDYNHYPSDVIANKRFPLWDGRDIREVNGNNAGLVNYVPPYAEGHGQSAVYGAAYHLHNWFNSLEVLRHKYATYGHAFDAATVVPLSKIQGDLDTLVRCNRRLGNTVAPEIGMMPNDAFPYYETNEKNEVRIETSEMRLVDDEHNNNHDNTTTTTTQKTMQRVTKQEWVPFGGNRPIYFQNITYVMQRNALVSKLIADDENKYGSYYTNNSTGENNDDAWKFHNNTKHGFVYYKKEIK